MLPETALRVENTWSKMDGWTRIQIRRASLCGLLSCVNGCQRISAGPINPRGKDSGWYTKTSATLDPFSNLFFFYSGQFSPPLSALVCLRKKDLLVTSKLSKSHPSQQFHNLLLYPFYFNYTIITHVPRNCLPLPCPIRRPKALQRRCNR